MTLLLAGSMAGCSKKERNIPPGPPGLPPSSGASADQPQHPMPVQGMPMDHPAVLRGRSEEPPAGSAAATEVIRGALQLADNVKAKVPAGGTIFLVARQVLPTGGPGPVLAAKRLVVGPWPQNFELTDSDVMMAGSALKGKVVLGARVDQDGDAMTKQVGDVEGISKPVDVPASGVVVLLDKIRTEAGGAPSPPGMGGQMPPGHPPTGMAPGMPPGHPPTGMPEGHPPTGAAPAMPPGHP